jgi:hypothetical protein
MDRMQAREERMGEPLILTRIFKSLLKEDEDDRGDEFKSDVSSHYTVTTGGEEEALKLDEFEVLCLRINMLSGEVQGDKIMKMMMMMMMMMKQPFLCLCTNKS